MCVILHLITSNKLLRTFIISYACSFTKPAISKIVYNYKRRIFCTHYSFSYNYENQIYTSHKHRQ